ncbi:MAG: BACON domain-containing protein [Bacteroidales bacterium]|nr:BACON domain-containing protein [Bacteroidales bacterium]
MNAGLFINNELLTLITTSKKGNLQFSGFDGDNEVYLFFLFDKTQKPPVKLHQEKRHLYYHEHPEILGDILKLADSDKNRIKLNGKKFTGTDVLNNIIQQVLTDNQNLIFEKDGTTDGSPFFLIVPPYLSEKFKHNLVKFIQQKIKPVTIINYVFPLINGLLEENKLPAQGNVLYIEMGYSDIYFQMLSTSAENKEIKIEGEDKITDSKLYIKTIQIVAEELVELAFHEFGFAGDNRQLNREKEIQYLLPDAQDVLMELNAVDDFNTIEVKVELSDGSAGSVLIHKEKVNERFTKILEDEGLIGKMNQLIKKLEPDSIVLNGEFLNNPLLLNFWNGFQMSTLIKHQKDQHIKICRTVFGSLDKVKKEIKTSEKALEVIDVESVEPQIIPADVIEVEPYIESQKIRKRKGILIKILIPVLIVIAAFLIYWYIPILSYKVSPENIAFGPKAGEIQLLKISSFGEWHINEVPGWLKLEISTATGTEEILVWTADENITNNSKTAKINVIFGNNISKSVEIVQHGVNKEIWGTPIENDSVSSFNEDTKTGNWSFNDLNKYIEEIRGSPEKIDFISLFNNIDPNCEVYYYINEEKISVEDITTFINKIKFGGTEKLVPNSLKYNSQGKLIEFGQE